MIMKTLTGYQTGDLCNCSAKLGYGKNCRITKISHCKFLVSPTSTNVDASPLSIDKHILIILLLICENDLDVIEVNLYFSMPLCVKTTRLYSIVSDDGTILIDVRDML